MGALQIVSSRTYFQICERSSLVICRNVFGAAVVVLAVTLCAYITHTYIYIYIYIYMCIVLCVHRTV